MQEKRSKFKRSSKKHAPKGLTILYEDQDILVVNKTNGLLTVSTNREKNKTAHFLLNDYVKKGNARSKNRVFIVHRLDRDTSGILIFAKNDTRKLVGPAGFEPTTSTTPRWRATKLRYGPINDIKFAQI